MIDAGDQSSISRLVFIRAAPWYYMKVDAEPAAVVVQEGLLNPDQFIAVHQILSNGYTGERRGLYRTRARLSADAATGYQLGLKFELAPESIQHRLLSCDQLISDDHFLYDRSISLNGQDTRHIRPASAGEADSHYRQPDKDSAGGSAHHYQVLTEEIVPLRPETRMVRVAS
ncbi:MAG: hypothetical protein OXH29_08115 [bacterium]|nr:hypothetical protein [bacterium]